MTADCDAPAAWLAGDRRLEDRLRASTRDAGARLTPLASGGGRRRAHGRLALPGDETLFVKRFPRAAVRHPRLEGIARRLGVSSAQREWRALCRAHAAGAPVPVPRGLWLGRDGDLWLATGYVEGRSLAEALDCDAVERRALLGEVARAVRRLHAAGVAHRDLHAGNVRIGDAGPVIVDLAASRRARSPRARRRDWGELEHSLDRRLSRSDRLRLRAEALGVARPFAPDARAGLRALGRAALRRRRAHMASRTRRAALPGRRFARVARDGWTGLRLRALDDADLTAALAAALAGGEGGGVLLKSDDRTRVAAVEVAGRRAIVKSTRARGWPRAIADAVRGSAGRRAWIGAHGLAVRGLGVAAPLAYLERRRFGLPVASALLLEDLRPARPADVSDAPAEAKAEALARLLIDLHRAGVHHGDLKASHVYLMTGAAGLETRLIDLAGVRFRRRLGDRERIRALCELNASLPDGFPNALREAVFRRYVAALPFRARPEAVRREIVRRSLGRRHRWSGGDQAGAMVVQRK